MKFSKMENFSIHQFLQNINYQTYNILKQKTTHIVDNFLRFYFVN